ncbi:procathepsin L-like [Candoia aspera]|uniref:procathepsin L-like n=1 Tax=Candoia aspera TaxID=51853 RepID=UPI002FD86305
MRFSILVVVLTWLISLKSSSTALDPALEDAWRDWKGTHEKEYAEGEESFRRDIWERNLRMIQEHNREADLGKHTYWLGMNHLGDLTHEEVNQRLSSFQLDGADQLTGNVTFFQASANLQLPKKVDWRTKGYVTAVKDQGDCRSCWAFSATGALEALHFKETRKLVSLSEQNLVDCSKKPNNGCRGGSPCTAFEYVMNQGINSEEDYPYDGKVGNCRYNPRTFTSTCGSIKRIERKDESSLAQAVATAGPISVGLDGRANHFHFYKSGIFSCPWHGVVVLNHAMLIVGYGRHKNTDFWIVKNSWSTSWGEDGYMRLEKGSNTCGIADLACYPIK